MNDAHAKKVLEHKRQLLKDEIKNFDNAFTNVLYRSSKWDEEYIRAKRVQFQMYNNSLMDLAFAIAIYEYAGSGIYNRTRLSAIDAYSDDPGCKAVIEHLKRVRPDYFN